MAGGMRFDQVKQTKYVIPPSVATTTPATATATTSNEAKVASAPSAAKVAAPVAAKNAASLRPSTKGLLPHFLSVIFDHMSIVCYSGLMCQMWD
jgi:hypothetical protein